MIGEKHELRVAMFSIRIVKRCNRFTCNIYVIIVAFCQLWISSLNDDWLIDFQIEWLIDWLTLYMRHVCNCACWPMPIFLAGALIYMKYILLDTTVARLLYASLVGPGLSNADPWARMNEIIRKIVRMMMQWFKEVLAVYCNIVQSHSDFLQHLLDSADFTSDSNNVKSATENGGHSEKPKSTGSLWLCIHL